MSLLKTLQASRVKVDRPYLQVWVQDGWSAQTVWRSRHQLNWIMRLCGCRWLRVWVRGDRRPYANSELGDLISSHFRS
ncbi:MAG: hypothetical protein AAGF24_00620 [Cyanobacteria bacterium P01_H01_bin.121]